MVAPLAGAWIEISMPWPSLSRIVVAPLAGAWIEIWAALRKEAAMQVVAPLAGAWIEIEGRRRCGQTWGSRPPRGGVD